MALVPPTSTPTETQEPTNAPEETDATEEVIATEETAVSDETTGESTEVEATATLVPSIPPPPQPIQLRSTLKMLRTSPINLRIITLQLTNCDQCLRSAC